MKHSHSSPCFIFVLFIQLHQPCTQVLISAGYEVATTCEDHHIFLREVFDEVMEEETVPEIQRTNLTKVVLHLKTMGVNDVLR